MFKRQVTNIRCQLLSTIPAAHKINAVTAMSRPCDEEGWGGLMSEGWCGTECLMEESGEAQCAEGYIMKELATHGAKQDV